MEESKKLLEALESIDDMVDRIGKLIISIATATTILSAPNVCTPITSFTGSCGNMPAKRTLTAFMKNSRKSREVY